MWGQERGININSYKPRIIPTRVGTSYVIDSFNKIIQDHPHACGDKLVNGRAYFFISGSSPRVWGQVPGFIVLVVKDRIIPTRVGTSSTLLSLAPTTQGSSPRVWGQASSLTSSFICDRIIPTRVGTRRIYVGLHTKVRDHPHACGDKVLSFFSPFCRFGSSPRVWGQVYSLMQACC